MQGVAGVFKEGPGILGRRAQEGTGEKSGIWLRARAGLAGRSSGSAGKTELTAWSPGSTGEGRRGRAGGWACGSVLTRPSGALRGNGVLGRVRRGAWPVFCEAGSGPGKGRRDGLRGRGKGKEEGWAGRERELAMGRTGP